MALDLAFWNLRHSLARTLLSVSGIGVAITLIFVQMGFQGAIENTANVIYGKMEFDVLVRSRDYLHFVDARRFSRQVLYEIQSWPGVQSVRPMHVTLGTWRHPDGDNLRGMVVMGIDPARPAFDHPAVARDIPRLTSAEFVIIDQQTHPEFGPRNRRRFGPEDIGIITDVFGKRVTVVGLFDMGAGLTANGAIITSEAGFQRLVPFDDGRQVSFGLVALTPGTSIESFLRAANAELRRTGLEEQIEILAREEVVARERHRWIAETPIGFIFMISVGISFIVGAAIVYMVLATDVANRISEYATLKAMGYANRYLAWVVLRQALYLSVIAFVPALLVSLGIYEITAFLANVPIFMTWPRFTFVLCLSLTMCGISGTLALRKLYQAQPAELF